MWLHHTLRLWQVCPKKLLRRTGELLSWKIMEKIGKQILTWLQVTKCMRSILILMPSRFGSVKSYELVHVDPKLGHPDAATGTTSRTIANVMCRGNPMVSYLYMICTCVQTYAITFVTRYTILYIYTYNHIYRYLCVPMLIIRSYMYINLHICVPGCIYVDTLIYTCYIYIY